MALNIICIESNEERNAVQKMILEISTSFRRGKSA
jgi:hypothetical protein